MAQINQDFVKSFASCESALTNDAQCGEVGAYLKVLPHYKDVAKPINLNGTGNETSGNNVLRLIFGVNDNENHIVNDIIIEINLRNGMSNVYFPKTLFPWRKLYLDVICFCFLSFLISYQV